MKRGKRMKFDKKVLADRMKHYRWIRNMRQYDLADKTGIPLESIKNYEQGDSLPKLENMIKLSRGMNVTLDELLEGVAIIGQEDYNYRSKRNALQLRGQEDKRESDEDACSD